jgi:hypothetical protein
MDAQYREVGHEDAITNYLLRMRDDVIDLGNSNLL